MPAQKFPASVRRDLRTVRDIICSDTPCNFLWMLAAAKILHQIAEEIERDVEISNKLVTGNQALTDEERAKFAAAGF